MALHRAQAGLLAAMGASLPTLLPRQTKDLAAHQGPIRMEALARQAVAVIAEEAEARMLGQLQAAL